MDTKTVTSMGTHYEKSTSSENLEHRGDEDSALVQFSAQDKQRILRKIDLRILPIVGAIYCISLVDRNNLGAASIAGMSRDLDLNEGMRYSVVTLAFFPTYIVFELPAMVLFRWIGPRGFLTSTTMTWAALMIGFGFTNNWKTLTGLRTLFGLLEAGFFPGCLYFLRYSLWYMLASVIGSFAGILSYGLMQLDGRNGLEGWRWIFIIEGVLTACVGIAAGILLVDFPDKRKAHWGFLSATEIELVIAQINEDRQDAEGKDDFQLKAFLKHGMDPKVWAFATIFGMTLVVGYSFSYFLPIILHQEMGFSTAASQCLVTPPYVAGGIIMYLEGWYGDKYRTRAPILLVNGILALVGLAVMAFTKTAAAKYVGAFVAVVGVNGNIPTAMAYQGNNIRGHWKRAFCSGTFVGFGGIGGIIGSLVFRSQDAPGYRPGIYACLASQGIVILLVLLLSFKFKRDNKKQAGGELVIEGHPDFRYTI